MKKTEKAIREALADMLDILAYKSRNGVMTEDDVRAVLGIIRAGGGIRATVKDLAGFYGQSEDNIRHVAHRNLLPQPTRRVYYDFDAFRRVIPPKWHSHASLPAD